MRISFPVPAPKFFRLELDSLCPLLISEQAWEELMVGFGGCSEQTDILTC